MKKILIVFALFLTTAAVFALPMTVYKNIPERGYYIGGTNKIVLQRGMSAEFEAYVYIHELAHWYYFDHLGNLARNYWTKTFKKEKFYPTEYCYESERHQIEECFAETIAMAVMFDEMPPTNTKTYKITQIIKKTFDKILRNR